MGLRFRKSVKICKGVSLNFSKSGVGVSLGTNGCRYSINSSGRSTATVGLPGTGLSYSKSFNTKNLLNGRSYNSSARKKKAELEEKKAKLQQEKQDEQKENQLKAEEYENYIELVKSVHKECDRPIDWQGVLNGNPPFKQGEKGPRETAAEKELSGFKPSLSQRLFKKGGEEKKQELAKAVEAAKAEDAEEYSAWEESKAFAKRILEGDTEAYLEAIEQANPFEDFADYGSDLEFGTDSADIMEIEFKVKSDEVVPQKQLSLTKTGKLSEKEMTKTMYYDITQDYVCSCAIRLAREIFAVLPVEKVLVHAVDGILDTATGNDAEVTILSVCFERSGFENINFDRIDPSDFLRTFPFSMSFAKTAGFKAVERLS